MRIDGHWIMPLRDSRKWLVFFSVLGWIGFVIVGAMALLAIGGSFFSGSRLIRIIGWAYLVVGFLYFPPAVLLGRSAKAVRRVVTGRDERDLVTALETQMRFWKYLGVLVGVWLSVLVLGILLAVIV